jgi:hypothetical protein
LLHSAVLVVLLMLVGMSGAVVPTPTASAQSQPADVAGILWLAPSGDPSSNLVEPGERLDLDVRVENIGEGDAFDVQVALPYNRESYLLTGGDNVSVSETEFSVMFGLVPPGEFRTISVSLRVRNDLRVPSVIYMRGDVSWDDARRGGDIMTNEVDILVDYDPADDDDDGARPIVSIPQDTTPPETCMLAVVREGRGYRIRWGGNDDLSGIRFYDVQVMKLPNGMWRDWKVDATGNDGWFGPAEGAHFGFRVRGRDRQGNEEAWPVDPQLTTLQADLQLESCPLPGSAEPI